jgi:hypothetical protein
MGDQASADKAIADLNGHKMGDNELKVNVAKPREERAKP